MLFGLLCFWIVLLRGWEYSLRFFYVAVQWLWNGMICLVVVGFNVFWPLAKALALPLGIVFALACGLSCWQLRRGKRRRQGGIVPCGRCDRENGKE